MRVKSIRQIFDDISLSLISFLENHTGITDIEFLERQGCLEEFLSKWEEINAPYTLPDDYKAFLSISDGLELKWKINLGDRIIPLGHIHLNKLNDVKIIQESYDKFNIGEVGKMQEEDEDEPDLSMPQSLLIIYKQSLEQKKKKNTMQAFEIDSECLNGKVAFIYANNNAKPQVQFQDLSTKWYFIANTFTDYFRLMIMHIGLPHWQYAFTEVGVDHACLQWFRYLSPNRLSIDIDKRMKLIEGLPQNINDNNMKYNSPNKDNKLKNLYNNKRKIIKKKRRGKQRHLKISENVGNMLKSAEKNYGRGIGDFFTVYDDSVLGPRLIGSSQVFVSNNESKITKTNIVNKVEVSKRNSISQLKNEPLNKSLQKNRPSTSLNKKI